MISGLPNGLYKDDPPVNCCQPFAPGEAHGFSSRHAARLRYAVDELFNDVVYFSFHSKQIASFTGQHMIALNLSPFSARQYL